MSNKAQSGNTRSTSNSSSRGPRDQRDTRDNRGPREQRDNRPPREQRNNRGPRDNHAAPSRDGATKSSASRSSTSTQSTSVPQGPRQMGRVKWFSNQFGFIRNVDSEDDYFVHFTALRIPEDVYGTLYTNEYVEFSVTKDENGKMFAVDVTGIKGGPLLCQYEPNNHRLRVRTRRHNRENGESDGEGEERPDRVEGAEAN